VYLFSGQIIKVKKNESFFNAVYILFILSGFLTGSHGQITISPKDTIPKINAANSSEKIDTLVSKNDTTTRKKQDITDTIFYEADKIDYDNEGKILILKGKSKVKYQNLTLHADTIQYDINQSLFVASGLPRLIEGKDTTVGDYMVYNIKTKRGRVQYASTHMDDGYFNGQNIVKTSENELYVSNGDYTTCEHVENPHFFFYGKTIKVVPKKQIVSKPVVFNVGDAPVAALPYFIFPIDRGRRSGILTPAWGGHPNSGGYVDNIGYYYVPNDYIDFLARGRIMDFREFVLEGSSRYALKYRLNGSITTRYVLNSDFINGNRQWAIDYNHQQNITPDGLTQLSGRGNLVSQKNFFKRFSEDSLELKEQNLTANLALTHRFENINASANLNWNRSHNLVTDLISEDLPSLSFSLPSRPIIPPKDDTEEEETKWYNKIYVDYNSRGIVKHTIQGEENKEEHFRPGFNNAVSVSSPQKILKYITVNPSFNANLSVFDEYIDTTNKSIDTISDTVKYVLKPPFNDTRYRDYETVSQDTLNRNSYGIPDSIRYTKVRKRPVVTNKTIKELTPVAWWNSSLSMSTNLYGMFPIKLFNFAGLRHTFSPSVSYTYVPEHKLDKRFYDIGIPYDAGHKRQQLINLSMRNQFDGKVLKPAEKEGEKPTELKFPLLSMNASTSYNFEAEKRKWSDLSLSASTGIKALRVNYSSSFWMYDDNDNLTVPVMRDMRLDLSAGSIGASGTFWGGDLLSLDTSKVATGTGSSNPRWDFNFTPSYSYALRRNNPTEIFTPEKNYNLSASANIKFTSNWSMSWSGNYNFTEDQWVQNSINVHCDLECWELRFQWRPEKLNPGYYFIVNIKKIPEIKWEQRD
jgi:lipopolysaccharide assembly outer membrane protein LptD (OstA)